MGISVDSATDVAKDAADVILLDKDLDVLADGVTEGRRIFANSRAWAIFPVCRCRHNRAITGRHTWRRSQIPVGFQN